MITYLDASALVKRYVAAAGSDDVNALIGEATALGPAVISRAEMAAALAKAARVTLVTRDAAAAALTAFNGDWEDMIRLQLTEALAARARVGAWTAWLRRGALGNGAVLA